VTNPTQSTSENQSKSTSEADTNSTPEAAKEIECPLGMIKKVLEEEEPSIQETIFHLLMVLPRNPQFSQETKFVSIHITYVFIYANDKILSKFESA
jgi:hypothetical protein